MSQAPFTFKKFQIKQDKCAMKVGTDGVLLGAWAELPNRGLVLDVGCGTGLISLMICQRKPILKIDAIEKVYSAANQANENVSTSPWNDNIKIIYNDFFKHDFGVHKYKLIVSNPPFYNGGHKSGSLDRDVSRNDDYFSLTKFIDKVDTLLENDGELAFIYPYSRRCEIENLAQKHNLYIKRLCMVKPTPNKEYHRLLVQLSVKYCTPEIGELVIEQNGRHNYSQQYILLTRDFYLNM